MPSVSFDPSFAAEYSRTAQTSVASDDVGGTILGDRHRQSSGGEFRRPSGGKLQWRCGMKRQSCYASLVPPECRPYGVIAELSFLGAFVGIVAITLLWMTGTMTFIARLSPGLIYLALAAFALLMLPGIFFFLYCVYSVLWRMSHNGEWRSEEHKQTNELLKNLWEGVDTPEPGPMVPQSGHGHSEHSDDLESGFHDFGGVNGHRTSLMSHISPSDGL